MSEAISRQVELQGSFIRLASSQDQERRIIAGYASVPIVDSYKTIFTTEALQEALDSFMEHPVLRYMHEQPVGKILPEYNDMEGITHRTHVDEHGLYVVAELAQGTQLATEAWELIKQGIINGFSIGGTVEHPERDMEIKQVDGEQVGIIHRLQLHEISVVDIPGNDKARFTVIRKDDMQSAPPQGQDGAAEVKRPIGPWPDFQACVDHMKAQGHTEEEAGAICGALEQAQRAGLELHIRKEEQEVERQEGDGSMEEQEVERQEGGAQPPMDQAAPPAPEAAPTAEDQAAEDDRLAALEQRVAAIEAAMAELRDMVQAALAPDGGTADSTAAEQPVVESVERRAGANIVAQASAGIDIRRSSRDDLLKALAEAEKGRM